MEAGDEMPFRLRQLLSMSTGFKMLGRSCKCSSNEIDLSAASKQIPAATKCLFATGLNGDCVNHSAVRGRCQEKFRSSIRQWHWNVAFSRMDSYIKPKIKVSLLSLFFFSFLLLIWPSNFLQTWYMKVSAKVAYIICLQLAYVLMGGLLVGDMLPSAQQHHQSLCTAPSVAPEKRWPAELPRSQTREHSNENLVSSLITHQTQLPSWLQTFCTKPQSYG